METDDNLPEKGRDHVIIFNSLKSPVSMLFILRKLQQKFVLFSMRLQVVKNHKIDKNWTTGKG